LNRPPEPAIPTAGNRFGMKIHPTAIIDPTAELDSSVEVGAYSIIGANVKIGAGCIVDSHVRIYADAVIGKNNRFYSLSIVNGEPQDLSFTPGSQRYMIIGDNNIFRELTNMHGSAKQEHATRIGDGNYFMGSTHVGHDSVVGNKNIVVQGGILAGHVKLGNNAFVSGLVAVHQFCRIGDNAMVSGCAKIVKDCPPYATTDGNPASVIGLRRAGFTPDQRAAIKQAYKTIYHSGLNIGDGVAALKESGPHTPETANIVKFFEESDRGVEDHR
jgi:UDP-N-acetylglucosamine acyltransferase